jgi:hypothetical protein
MGERSSSKLSASALLAGTPSEWLATHFAARSDEAEEHASTRDRVRAGWRSIDDLLADDALAIRDVHAVLVADGVPPKAAATYLADWTGGMVADAVGFALATAGAGFLVDPAQLRLHQHPDGWFDRVELGTVTAVVGPDHPWAGQYAVVTGGSTDDVLARTVHALIAACEPLVDACRSLAPVGRVGLWNEIGDSLGAAIAHQDIITVTNDMVAILERAVRVPGSPWGAHPSLRFAHSELLGRVHVVQKGGCCLAYTRTDVEAPDLDDLDDDRRAYLERFPRSPDQQRYCTTCSFRDPGDCDARLVFWRERRALARQRC